MMLVLMMKLIIKLIIIILLKKFKKDIINSTELDDDFETLVCDIKTNKWFEKHKKK